jgi:predicted nucleic acid-binding protein
MIYVLDSNVAFKWHVREDGSDQALRVRDDFIKGIHTLLSPDIFPVEIAHSLTRAERQGRITPVDGALHLQDMLATLPQSSSLPLPPAESLRNLLSDPPGRLRLPLVALAEREGCGLLTADQKLITNLQRAFPFITALSTLP